MTPEIHENLECLPRIHKNLELNEEDKKLDIREEEEIKTEIKIMRHQTMMKVDKFDKFKSLFFKN